jgi:hypothetical protein
MCSATRTIRIVLTVIFALTCRSAAAQTVVLHEDIPIPPLIVNPCNGDVIAFTGGHTLEVAKSETPNGIDVLAKLTSTAFGVATVTTTPLTTHDYHMNDTNLFEVNIGTSGASELTLNADIKVIGPSTVANFHTGLLVHLTLNANGTASAVVENPTYRCQ